MFTQFFALTVLFKLGFAQINGEFWWLNDKIVEHNGIQPDPPKFEDLSEFDSDESVKILFRDNNLVNTLETPIENFRKARKEVLTEPLNLNLIKWPEESQLHSKKRKIDNYEPVSVEELTTVKQSGRPESEDKLTFIFPEDNNFVWKDLSKEALPFPTPETKNTTNDKNVSANMNLYDDRMSFNVEHKEEQSQNICTYMKKNECLRRNGIILQNSDESKKRNLRDPFCCVLPLQSKEVSSSNIYFPDMLKKPKRFKRPKRSNDDLGTQTQRKNLLHHKHNANQRYKAKTQIPPRITTPDYEYDDPYWNIKTVKSSNKKKQESNKRFDYSDESDEDYAVEIPRPGLIGIYSDYGHKPTNWGVYYDDKESPYDDKNDYDEDDGVSFGYSTIDPRLATKSKPKRGRPQKLSTDSVEVGYNAESQTISYNSYPNFNVLKDFKLPNLMRDKSKSKSRTTTTESFADDDTDGVLIGDTFESDEVNEEMEEHQVFKDCGRAVKMGSIKSKAGKQIGSAVNGSHPWLAVIVPTRKPNSVLCYATLIHPRAAITAADCVHNKQASELTLITGLWNLNERTRARSRVPTVRVHPQFKGHNVALLYWKTPLRLGLNVQPACIAATKSKDDCMFVGWGGFDQAIRPQSRWQRATIHSCKDHLSLNGVNIPSEAFCTTVQARNTVTGIGGSLICMDHGRMAVVGVAVSRDSTMVMLPVYEWVTRAISLVHDQ